MAGDVERKSRKRRVAGSSSSLLVSMMIPSRVVCATHGLSIDKQSLKLVVLFCMALFGLWGIGFWGAIQSLPEVSTGRQLGTNLNIAKLSTTTTTTTENNKAGRQPERFLGVTIAIQDEAETVHVNKNNHDKPKHLPIPVGKWPVTLKEELDDYEILIHPGDHQTKILVPKFWAPPLHNKQQFTREQAMQIGTCAQRDPSTASLVRGMDCPLDERTIFIAIASYRDFQCRYTVESAFLRAKNPKRIRVGVVDQIVDGEDVKCNSPIEPCEDNPSQALCKYKSQVDVYQMDAPLSVGPVFARHIGHRMYRGEYYATQVDAHVTFSRNWDADIIDQMEATHNEMAVLTTYLSDVQDAIDPITGDRIVDTRPIMCNSYYEGGHQGLHLRHGTQPERQPSIHGSPQLEPWWAAGYSFSRGHFIVNVPYDPYQPMIFQGEEMSIGIRGFTIGYDYYAPERSVCFHHYAWGKNEAVRRKVKRFWENGDRYPGTGVGAMARLLGIVHMNPETSPSQWDHAEEDRYGLGGVRTPEKFYKMFGIDVVKKKTQGHLCIFVGDKAEMHKSFTPHLRSDGMGIDYSNINFQFVDPAPDQPRKEPDEEE